VTFLFTDIENSTALWEQHPDEMRQALERHDRIVHDATAANAGLVFSPRRSGRGRSRRGGEHFVQWLFGEGEGLVGGQSGAEGEPIGGLWAL
jgi:class 3 adenylate cyclase